VHERAHPDDTRAVPRHVYARSEQYVQLCSGGRGERAYGRCAPTAACSPADCEHAKERSGANVGEQRRRDEREGVVVRRAAVRAGLEGPVAKAVTELEGILM
jgi:hypothetical protein